MAQPVPAFQDPKPPVPPSNSGVADFEGEAETARNGLPEASGAIVGDGDSYTHEWPYGPATGGERPGQPGTPAREQPFPPGLPIQAPRRRRGLGRWVHGFHARTAIELVNPMACDTCVLAAIRKKNPRHPLACREAKKHARCSILERHQAGWTEGLVDEIRSATGREPTAIQRSQVEQILRLRGRVFGLEVYLSAAGLVDVRTGEPRAIVDRLTSIENALARATGELRSSLAEAREGRRPPAPTLPEYLDAIAKHGAAVPAQIEDASSQGILADASTEEEGT